MGAALAAMLLMLPGMALALNGGDELWTLREQLKGKQDPEASVTDSAGNIIITGSHIPPGGSDDQFYTIKVRPDGTVAWRASYSKAGFKARAAAVAVDGDNNVYVAGSVVSAGNTDIVTIRYDADQATAAAVAKWERTFDGGIMDSATSLAVVSRGNGSGEVYVGGSSRYNGNESFLVLNYEKNNGGLAWQIPNPFVSIAGKAKAVAVNGDSVVVTGQTWSGNDHYFKTMAYALNGQSVRWETPLAGLASSQSTDAGTFVKSDSRGHFIVAGTLSNGSDQDIYTAKYCGSSAAPCEGKAAGDLLWSQTYNGGSEDEPDGLAIDSASDDVFVTGRSYALATGRYHIYTVRYAAAAVTPQTVWPGGGMTFNSGNDNSDIPAAVVADGDDGLFVAGYTENTAANSDFRVIKYRKSTGAQLWTRTFHGAANRDDRAVALGLDQSSPGQFYAVGFADETTPLVTSTVTDASPLAEKKVKDGTRNWVTNAWANHYVMMTSGSNAGSYRLIQSNDATTLTLAYSFGADIAAGDAYYIYDNDDLDYYIVRYEKGELNAPTGLTATTASNTSINLVWQDNNAVTPSFRVQRCTDNLDHLTSCNFDNPEKTVTLDAENRTSLADSGLIPGQYYYYRVKAYTAANGETYPSSVAHAITQLVNTVSPAGADLYIYAGVADNDDYALSVAAGPDGNPVVTGKSFFDPGGLDYYTIKLNRSDLRTKLWSQRYDDSQSQEDTGMCLAIDRNNQIIVSGYAYMHNPSIDRYMNSIYTIKYKADAAPEPENDPDLIDEWSHQYNGPGATDDRPQAIATATDGSGNVAVIGIGMHSSTDYSLGHDIYLLHYPPAGPTAAGYWAATPIDKGGEDQPTAVAFDPDGNVIITGFSHNVARGDYDIYTAKFCGSTTSRCPSGKSPGDLLWEVAYDGVGNGGLGGSVHFDDQANDVAVDMAGGIYVTGYRANAAGNWDYVTIKYDGNGVLLWDRSYDGPGHGDDESVSVKVDPTSGNIVVAGNRLTDPGNNDFHLIRYAADGAVIKQTTLLRENGNEDMIEMAMDGSGNVFVTGTTDTGGGSDILTIKVDRQGNIIGSGSIFTDSTREDKPYDITTNYLGEAFVAGITRNGASNADYVVFKIDGDAAVGPHPLTCTTPGYTSVTLSWPPVAATKGGHYHLQRQEGACDNNTSPVTPLPDQPAEAVSFTDNGLIQARTYCYSIQHDNGALSPWVLRTVTTSTPPAPSAVTAAASGTTKVTLAWTPQSTGHTGFEVWRCVDSSSVPCSDFTLLQAMEGTATTYDDTTACPGGTYRYQVRTTGPGWQSLLSSAAGAIPPSIANMAFDPGFEAPEPLSAGNSVGWTLVGGTATGDITFDPVTYHGGARSLNINAVGTASQSGIKQYVLFSPGGKYQLSAWMKSAAATGTLKCDTLDGSSFSLVNTGTTGDWEKVSQTLAVTTSVPATGARLRCYVFAGAQGYFDDLEILPVYDLTATRATESHIDLAWLDSSPDESGYRIERCADPESGPPCSSFTVVATVGANATSYRDPVPYFNTGYRYRIRPYKTFAHTCGGNNGWEGAYSNTASAVATVSSPVLTATAADTTLVNLSWSDTTLAETGFQVVRCSGDSCTPMPPFAPSFPFTGSGAVAFADSSACNFTTYNYWVRPVNTGLGLGGTGVWTRRIPVVVSNAQGGVQTKLVISYRAGMKSDFSDIRLYDEAWKAEMPYWVESVTSGASATIWFKPNNGTNAINLYYGNSNASAPNTSGSVIFDFFDDFSGSNLGKWSVSLSGSATATVSGGVATLDGTANAARNSYLTISKGMTPPYRVEARINNTSSYLGQGLIRNRMLTSGISTDTGIFDVGGSYLQAYNVSATTKQVPADQYVRVKADHVGGTANVWSIFKEDGTQIYSTTYTGTPSAIAFSEGDSGGGNGKIIIDWVYARKYAAVEPAASLGTPGPADSNDAGLVFDFTWDGPWSKPTAGAATPAPTQVTTPAVPGAPTLSAVTQYSEQQIDVTWTFPSGKDQTGFKIDRCADETCDTVLVTHTVTNAAARTFNDTGLPLNTPFWYRVRAYKTEDPSCNGGLGFWQTANSSILGTSTNLRAPVISADPGKTFSRITTECDDIRIVDSDGITRLPYYLAANDDTRSQCNRTATKLIVKVPSIPAGGKTLSLYYGNLVAAAGSSSGTTVFDFFEDFDGSAIDTTRWTITDGTGFSVGNGRLTGTNTSGRLTSKSPYTFGAGYQAQAKVKASLLPTYGFAPLGFRNSWYDNSGWHHHPGAEYISNNNGYVQMAGSLPAGTAQTDAMIYTISLKTGTASLQMADVEGVSEITYWDAGNYAQTVNARPIVIGKRYDDGNTNLGYSAVWEWIRVRKYSAAGVSVALGGVDTAGAPYALSGEPGTWRFRKPVTVNYDLGNPVLTNYQVNVVTDTTGMATPRNTITWTDMTAGETSFVLERCSGDPCGEFAPLPGVAIGASPGSGAAVKYVDKNLQLDSPLTPIQYCYRVKAVNTDGGGNSVWSTGYSDTACVTTTVQGAPTNFTATPGTSQILLGWTDNSIGETGFTIERCRDSESGPCDFTGGSTVLITVPPNDSSIGTGASYTDTNLCSGTYRYRISAFKNNPDGTSWILGPTSLAGDSASTGMPVAPQNVVASRVTEQQIRVTWKDTTPDEAGFEVWRCSGSTTCTDFSKLPVTVAAAAGTGGTVTYDDNYLVVPGTAYRYMIKAFTASSCGVTPSDPSLPNSAAPPNGPDHATATINAPTAFFAAGTNSTQVDLGWGDTTAAESGFSLKRCGSLPSGAPTCSSPMADVATTAAGAITYTDASACSGTTYLYTVAPVEHPTMPFTGSGGQSWQNRSALTISGFVPNFLTRLTIVKGADKTMQDDFRDIRFFDRDNGVELPYWIQSNTGTGSAATAIVWFKTGASANVDLYYGNASATSASSKSAVFGTGLVAYWPFEEAAGTIIGTTAERSGSGINGTLSGFGTGYGVVSGGAVGNGLKLDGSNDYVNVADATGSVLDITGSMTMEVWYNYTGANAPWARLVSKGVYPNESYMFMFDGTGTAVAFLVNSGSNMYVQSSLTPTMTPGWHHLVGRYDAENKSISLFLDGNEVLPRVAVDPAIAVVTNNSALGIGANSTGGGATKGMIDELRIYGRAMLDTEIPARYSVSMPSVAVGAKTGTGTAGTATTAAVVTPMPGNILVNPDFESYTNNWSVWPDWTGVSSDTAVFFSGKMSLKQSKALTANSSRTMYQVLNNLKPGGTYTLSGYIKANLATTGRAWCGLSNWATAVNWGSDTSQFQILASDAAKNNQGWIGFTQQITLPVVAPGGGSISQLNVECGVSTATAATQTAWFDAIQLVQTPPINVTAARLSEAVIDVNWNDIPTEKTGFNLYRCMDSGSECTFGPTPYKQLSGTTTYRDTGLTPGQTYRYRVTAYKTATCPWETPASNTAFATTAQLAPTLATPVPLTATSLQLIWNRTTTTETGYNIERCTGNTCENFATEYSNVAVTRPLDAGLKARYTFDGTINDTSGNGLNLTSLYNYTPVYEDGGLRRNSVYNLQSQSTSILNTDVHTIEFDIKFRSTVCSNCTEKIFGFNAGGSDRSPGIWVSGGNRIYWRYNPGDKGVNVGVDADGGTPFAVGNWYRIRGVKNGSNFKVFVNEKKIADINTVPAVKSAGSATIDFGPSWADVVLKNFSIYSTIDDPSLVAFTDGRLCPDTWYTYRVTPVKLGDWAGVTSDPKANTTPHFDPPRNLTATGVSDVQADLSWQPGVLADQTAFKVKRCVCQNPEAGCSLQVCDDPLTVDNKTTYSSKGLTPETTYAFHVAAWRATEYCNAEHGIVSDYTSIMTDPQTQQPKYPQTFPERAGSLTATALNPYKILLEWEDESLNEDGFIVETKIWNDRWIFRSKLDKRVGEDNRMSYLDTIGIEPGKKYFYRVRAYKGSDISPPSNEAQVTYTYPGGATIGTTPPFTGGDKSTCPCDAGKILVDGQCTAP